MGKKNIPLSPFGKEGPDVTAIGLGGEGVLRTFGRDGEAEAVILEAVLQGIAYYDCARVYAGSEGYYGTIWARHPEMRSRIFQTSKSASRDKKGALADLDKSLAALSTDYLDLWQIHDVRTEDDFRRIAGPGGALEAFLEAKKKGRARYVGVTGHHDPFLLARAVQEWPVDSVLMPVNPAEASLGGFLDTVLPAAKKKGAAVVAMKVLGAGHYLFPDQGITAETLIRFALSREATVVIAGCADRKEVRTLADAGRARDPLSLAEQGRIVDFFRPYARKFAYYRGVF
jgi:aryl-alcohol dehydrogenase-like predicted oxidoreductase